MSINGIGQYYYQDNTVSNKYNKNKAEPFSQHRYEAETNPEEIRQNASAQDIYEAYRTKSCAIGQNDEGKDEEKETENDEQKTDTEIVVKADGSKIMMTTIRVGGTETVMSVEIAQPADYPSGNPSGTVDNPNMMISDNDTAIESVSEK